MDFRHFTVVLTLGILMAASPLQAQANPPQSPVTEVSFSLAESANLNLTVEPGKYQLRLTELAPAVDYAYRQESIRVNPPKITAPAGIASAGCAQLQQTTNDLRLVSDESKVVAAKQNVVEALKLDVTGCPTLVVEAKAVIAATEVVLGPFAVTTERGFAVTVLRGTPPTKNWRIELLPERQRFFFSYGFNAFHDQDEEYFAKPAGSDETGKPLFLVTPKADDEEWDVSPSVLLTILAPWEWAQSQDLSLGFSAGAGFDGEVTSPEIYLGPTLVMWDNIFLSAGALLHPQKRLLGEVSLTETTATALTDDQLHHTTHDWNWFVGVSFRFGRPQKAKTGTAAVEDPKPEEGKATRK